MVELAIGETLPMHSVIWLRAAALALILSLPPALGLALASAPIDGLWRATAEVKGAQIPFRLEITGQGEAVRAHFFDGPRSTNPSAEGTFHDGHLHLVFPSYAAVLDATLADGRLQGTYATPGHPVAIQAVKGPPSAPAARAAPAIGGEWIIPYHSDKGENAWRLIVRQDGARAQGAILRIDGDTGTLDGVFENGAFQLSHFAGERAALLTITPDPGHGLKLVLQDGAGRREFEAIRPAVAARAGVAPTDPRKQASVADRAAPFRFAFKDLNGRLVSNDDPRFRGKVVVIDVMGSWCPNCHDEAPFLQSLYARHHKDGLEVVALDFEQAADQVADPARLRAFIARYGLTYTVLLAGQQSEVNARLPQAQGLNAWPTTFFIGRDGRVKATHAGFTSPGSGPRDLQTRRDVEHEVETLLAQKA
jgi:thiol-disulfide isomerase/thioredoxin